MPVIKYECIICRSMNIGVTDMRFAFVNGVKTEALPKLIGICPCCGGETVAKCGRFKIHHWAHKDKTTCDPWWENESEWHRGWKSYFSVECQEVVFKSANGERHIADVYTPNHWVIEVQSYSIDDQEARAREAFYGQMVWIINGSKSEFDKTYFNLSLHGPYSEDRRLYGIQWYGRGKLLAKWSTATKHVFLDFGGDVVWQLLKYDPKTKNGEVRVLPKKEFVEQFAGTYPPTVAVPAPPPPPLYR